MALRKRDDDLVFPNAAGTDVGCSSHWVAVLKHRCGDPVLEFGVMTDDLNAMACVPNLPSSSRLILIQQASSSDTHARQRIVRRFTQQGRRDSRN